MGWRSSGRFLRLERGLGEPSRIKPFDIGAHTQGLPRLVSELERYQRLQQKNWRPARRPGCEPAWLLEQVHPTLALPVPGVRRPAPGGLETPAHPGLGGQEPGGRAIPSPASMPSSAACILSCCFCRKKATGCRSRCCASPSGTAGDAAEVSDRRAGEEIAGGDQRNVQTARRTLASAARLCSCGRRFICSGRVACGWARAEELRLEDLASAAGAQRAGREGAEKTARSI